MIFILFLLVDISISIFIIIYYFYYYFYSDSAYDSNPYDEKWNMNEGNRAHLSPVDKTHLWNRFGELYRQKCMGMTFEFVISSGEKRHSHRFLFITISNRFRKCVLSKGHEYPLAYTSIHFFLPFFAGYKLKFTRFSP